VHKAHNGILVNEFFEEKIGYENWNLKYGKWNNRSSKKVVLSSY